MPIARRLWSATFLLLWHHPDLGDAFHLPKDTPPRRINTAAWSLSARPARVPRGPKQARPTRTRNRTDEDDVVFDASAMTAVQDPNEDAPRLHLKRDGVFPMPRGGVEGVDVAIIERPEIVDDGSPLFRFYSLDEVTGIDGLSSAFNADSEFRDRLRRAFRDDILDTTPYYQSMSEIGRDILRQPDSSLEGSWKCEADRMRRLSHLLDEYGFSNDGDALLNSIGAPCGPRASTHWIDIVGVKDRKIKHSWHQDCRYGDVDGELPTTVLWGFPPTDGYVGTGVFSHVASLDPSCRVLMEEIDGERDIQRQPVVYEGSIDEKYLVRPCYRPGWEFLVYRDFDVLHSSPDVAHRTSVMRFM